MFHSRFTKWVIVLAVLGLFTAPSVVFAQAPQRPTNPFHSEFDVSQPPRQFEEVTLLLEVRPGASTVPFSWGGDQFVTVLAGQLTRRDATTHAETVSKAGSTYVQKAGEPVALVNAGKEPARLFATVLLPTGASLTSGRPLPDEVTIQYQAQREFPNPPATFKVVQDVLDFAPGAWVPLHHHGGDVLGLVIQGEMTNRIGGVETTIQTGQGFGEDRGQVHTIGNASAAPAATFRTILLPPGGQIITIEGAPPAAHPATSATPSMLPVTGAAENVPIDPWLALLVGMVLMSCGLVLRRRRS